MPYNYFNLLMAEKYYAAGAMEQANAIMERMTDIHEEKLAYFEQFYPQRARQVSDRMGESLALMQFISETATRYDQEELADRAWEIMSRHYEHFGAWRP